jgi:serine/threonine-protein kinase
MAINTVSALVELLRRQHLLEPGQLDELVKKLQPRYRNPRDICRELLRRGWLTPFQVNQLLTANGDGLVVGQYLLLERLSEGALGEVFRARHQHMKRIVTLQLVRGDMLGQPRAVEQFYQEIQAASQVSHPHLVAAYDAGPVGSSHFFAMEYVEGIDLERLVKQTGPLPVGQACDFIYQAALGLQHAFQRGLLHHDLKPGNLLVSGVRGAESGVGSPESGTPVVKIRNLGLTMIRQHTRHTRLEGGSGRLGGSGNYTLPPPLAGQPADVRTELYSLGCTFYFLLTGRAPFARGTTDEKVIRHLKAEPAPIRSLRPEVPEEVAAVVRKLMAKRPEDRYQTPGEVASALARWSGQGGPLPAALRAPSDAAEIETVLQWAAPLAPPTSTNSSRSRLRGPTGMWNRRTAVAGGLLLSCLAILVVLLARSGNPAVNSARDVAGASGTLNVSVEANQPWQDTHVDLQPGTEVFIRAVGKWKGAKAPECDARGDTNAPRERNVRRDAPRMCLLLRIGNEDPPQVAGMHRALRPKKAGRLFVQANDLDLAGNSGQLKLEIQGGKSNDEDAPIWLHGYGQYDEGTRRVKTFVPLPFSINQGWQPSDVMPDPAMGWIVLTAEGGHPGNTKERAVIRRWHALRDGAVSITGTLAHPAKDGDGVQARVVSSRHGELGSWVAHGNTVPTNVAPAEVRRGDTIDCIVDCRSNADNDAFTWAPVLRLLPTSALKR